MRTPHVQADTERIRAELLKTFERFTERLTRVDAYIRDINAEKGGLDMRCVIEARPRGLDPLTAEHTGETPYDAVRGAADKLERVLEARFGKLDERR